MKGLTLKIGQCRLGLASYQFAARAARGSYRKFAFRVVGPLWDGNGLWLNVLQIAGTGRQGAVESRSTNPEKVDDGFSKTELNVMACLCDCFACLGLVFQPDATLLPTSAR